MLRGENVTTETRRWGDCGSCQTGGPPCPVSPRQAPPPPSESQTGGGLDGAQALPLAGCVTWAKLLDCSEPVPSQKGVCSRKSSQEPPVHTLGSFMQQGQGEAQHCQEVQFLQAMVQPPAGPL